MKTERIQISKAFLTKRELLSLRKDYSKLIEAYVAWTYSRLLPRGSTAIDAGLNWGMHFYPLAEIVGPDGLVIGIEANSFLAERAQQRITKDKLDNCRVVQKALSDRVGHAEFLVYKDQLGLSHIAHDGPSHPSIRDEGELQVVSTTTFDDLQLESVTFIKSDLEGADFTALCGGKNLLEREKPLIIFEMIPHLNARQFHFSVDDFFGFFEGLGYLLFDIHGQVFGRDEWEGSSFTIYWELVAIHKDSDFLGPWFLETARFWQSAIKWPIINDWGSAALMGLDPPIVTNI